MDGRAGDIRRQRRVPRWRRNIVVLGLPAAASLRDVHALAQHFIVRRDTLVTAGAVLGGQDVQLMVF